MQLETRDFYTPRFTSLPSITIKRFAWAIGKPMTKTISIIARLLPYMVNLEKVCKACKAKSKKEKTQCKEKYCAFYNPQPTDEELAKILEKVL